MAAEASRSGSSGAADSYVGSLISLTSKSEIRYEGILFNINTDEASIGLQNVRSFGTEGRRKDGPQVPAIDKVYEYIVFRGSDIKDLQVKSSPPVQTAPPVHNDPAIIQSHYTAPTAPSSLPSAPVTTAAGPVSDFTNQVSQPGAPITTYQNNVPMYPPGGNMPSWNPSAPPTTNVGGVSVPMYWQGYYGPSGSMQMQQQPLLRPIQSLSTPSPVQPQPAQQPVQYPTINSSLSNGASNISAPQSMEFPPALLQPIVSSTPPMHSSVFPVHSSALTADSATNMMPSKGPSQVVSQSANSPLVPPVLSNSLDRGSAAPMIPNQAKPISTSSMSFNGFSESRSSVGGKSTSPALVTPGQFLQPGPTISQTAQIEQKDVEVVQVSSMVSAPQSVSAPQPSTALKTASAPQSSTVLKTAPAPQSSTVLKTASASQSSTVLKAAPAPENQPPLLPLPSPSNSRMNGVPAQTHYINRGGRDRRRGNEFSHPVANFTEDFDFEAMNEKFKKDEVWGDLGKSKSKADDGIDFEDEDDVVVPKADANPVYKKDDFFDTLSCNSLDRESHNGRTRFSEQMRLDTETFGNFPRNRGFRGGRGPGGGRSRGGYYGRGNGYGYVGRGGRGGQNVYRAI